MDTSMQVLKIALKVLLVIPPRQPVHAGSGILFEFVERLVEQVVADILKLAPRSRLARRRRSRDTGGSSHDATARFCQLNCPQRFLSKDSAFVRFSATRSQSASRSPRERSLSGGVGEAEREAVDRLHRLIFQT